MENIQDLVARVISGDMQAFEAIYQATYRQVYYTCLSFLKNEQNTLDMMQETYITALTHLQQLDEPERIAAWLNRIAVNKCKDFLTKKMPVLMDDDSIIDQPVLEENDNFLPESYVINAEKRKIILTIMQEELTAIQYQTILLYYFDGMSVPEIAACMECPEGTVKYRLSAARGKIKQGVQDYENTSGIKLYSSGSVALLTAIFVAESQSLVIPNVLANIFAGAAGLAGTAAGVAGAVASTGTASAIGGGAAGAATGTAAGGAVGVTATGTAAGGAVGVTATGTATGSAAGATATASAGTGAAVAGTKAAGVAAGKAAGKAGIKGLFQTLKAKIIAGVAATAVVAGGVAAGVALHNKPDTGKHYKDYDIVICDNEYMTLTIDRVYEQGYIPDQEEVEYPIKEDLWNTESNVVRYTVKNNLHKQIFYEFRFLSANGEWMDDDRETETTWYLDADDEMTICMNNPNRWIGSTGRDSLTWAKTELYVWMMNDEGVAEQLDYEIQDVYFTDKNKIAPNYERKAKEGDEVVVDNDQVRITYIGSYIIDELDKNAFSNDPYFYVENKTDHDLKIEVEGTATLDGKTAKMDQVYDKFPVLAGCNGYITGVWTRTGETGDRDDKEATAEIIRAQIPFDVTFKVYDYTESYGGYINDNVYGTAHGNSIKEILDPTMKQYDAQIVMRAINDKKGGSGKD